MKKTLFLLLLSSTIGASAQITVSPHFNDLLIAPEALNSVTWDFASHKISECRAHISELEKKMAELEGQGRKGKKEKKNLVKEISAYEVYLADWVAHKEKLVPPLVDGQCFVLQTADGSKTQKEVKMLTEKMAITYQEQIPVEAEKVGQWVKKRVRPTGSTFVLCWEEKLEHWVVLANGGEMKIDELPANYDYDKSQGMLIKNYAFEAQRTIFQDKESGRTLEVVAVEKVECE